MPKRWTNVCTELAEPYGQPRATDRRMVSHSASVWDSFCNLSRLAATATGAATPLGAHATVLYQAIADAGEARKDFSFVFRWLCEQDRNKVVS